MSSYAAPTQIQAVTLAKSSDINAINTSTATAFSYLPTENSLKLNTTTYVQDTGITANNYVVTQSYSPVVTTTQQIPPTTYVDGMEIIFKTVNANTGDCLINLNGWGTKSILQLDGSALIAGDIQANVPIILRYSSSTGAFHLAQPFNLAKTWATSLTVVSGGQYGALKYANDAASQATSASNSAANAAATLTNFNNIWMGSRSSPPAATIVGSLYFNTTSNTVFVWSGSAWIVAYAPITGYMQSANNLSDVSDINKARNNLGINSIYNALNFLAF